MIADGEAQVLRRVREQLMHGATQVTQSEIKAGVDAARYRYEFTPKISAIGYADIGGFGVRSKLAWQVFSTLNYELAQNMYASLGYRHIAVDYRKSGRRLDINMSGPMLGFSYQF